MNFVEPNRNPRASESTSRARATGHALQRTPRHDETMIVHSRVEDGRDDDGHVAEGRGGNDRDDEQEAMLRNPSGLAVGFLLLREIVQVMLPALLLALVIHLFLAQATVVYGRSMEPSLFESQRLIIDKISYRVHPPQRNDIVVLNLPEMDEMLVKRIIGLPGEKVEVRDGMLYINDVLMEETFISHTSHYDFPPITLGPLNYFVLGDNRGNSNDSRSFGPVQREYIVGRVWLRYWPLRQFSIF